MSPALVSLLSSVGWTLVDFVWQGALIGCATAIALTLLRNAKPEQRYLAACTGMLLCLLWPAIDLVLRLSGGPSGGASMRFAADLVASGSPEASAGLLGWLQGHLLLLVGGWAACAAVLTLRMALGLLWIGRAAQNNRSDACWQARLTRLATQFGISRTVRLRIVDNLASPITAGWWRPVVLVPASLVSGMPQDLLEALLAHELAHVKRFDYLVNLGQNVAETLLFYHPAVWWLSNRIRDEREQIADDLAATQLGEPRRLAQALSELERIQFSNNRLAIAANGGDLMARIKRLVRPDSQALSWKAALPVLGLATILATGCAQAPAVKPSDKETPTVQAPPVKASGTRTVPVVAFNSCSRPEYPRAAQAAGIQGTVTLAFLVGEDGKVLDSKVTKSSGREDLDEAARVPLSKCKFKPAMRGGRPEQSWTAVQYVWTLE